MNDYVLKEEIGKGNMSVVYKGRKKRTIHFFAIYSIEKNKRERVLNNVGVLRNLTHRNVINFYNWYETANHLWLITELCVGGDLGSILSHDKKMTETSVRLLGADIAAGLSHIHSKGHVYRDLKPGNLLMDSTAMLRFYDFGLACSFGAAADKPLMGTPLYMAPELFIQRSDRRGGAVPGVPSMASDLWSMGCVLYEMANGESAFAGKNVEEVLRNVLTLQPRALPHMSDAFNELVLGLLEKNPLKRATWADVRASPFWEGVTVEFKHQNSPPREPVFEEYRRAVENSGARPSRVGSVSSLWSDEDIRIAVQAAVEAAQANLASSPAFNEEEEGFGEVNPRKEVDFTPPSNSAALSSGVNGASADAMPARRSTGASATTTTAAHARNQPGSPHTLCGSHGASRAAAGAAGSNGDLGGGARRLSNNFTAGNGSTRRASVASNRGSNASGSPRPSAFFTSGEQITTAQLEEIGGRLLRGTMPCNAIWHSTDSNTRPLYGNVRIEKYVEPAVDPTGFTFKPLKRNELKDLEDRALNTFIRSIYKQLNTCPSDSPLKKTIPNYIETIASETTIANMLVNSSIMTLCIDQMEDVSMAVNYRAAAASVAGMLIRHACQIAGLAQRTKVVPRLLQLFCSETNIVMKRRIFVCIGELVFYVYTQDATERAQWDIVPEELERTFVAALDTEDDAVRHYAAKTIENLSTTYDKVEAVCTAAVVERLLAVFALPPEPTRNHHMRSSALCAALRLATWREELIPVVLYSNSVPRDTYGTIVATTAIQRTAHVILAFLVVALIKAMVAKGNAFAQAWAALPGLSRDAKFFLSSSLRATEADNIISDIAELSEDLVDKLCDTNERSGPSLKGKTMLYYVVMGCLGGTLLPRLCTSRNIASLDSILREDDPYVEQCSKVLSAYISIYVSEKLASLSRKPSPSTAPLYLSSLQQVLSAGILRGGIDLQPDFFKTLGDVLLKALGDAAYSPYEDDLNALADRITQSPNAVVQYQDPICTHLIPPYTEMLQRKSSQHKFSALRFLVSVTAPLSTDSRVQRDRSGAVSGAVGRGITLILATVKKSLSVLLSENTPIPSYTMRLLATCGECSPTALNGILSTTFFSSIMGFLSSTSNDGDLFYPLRLILLALNASSSEEHVAYVVRQGLLPMVLKALHATMGNGSDHMQEVGCEIALSVLTRGSSATSSRLAVQGCAELMEGDAFAGVFLPLATSDVGNPVVNEKAAQVVCCLVRHSADAQAVVLAHRGIRAVTELLDRQPLNAAAAEWVLRAVRSAAENLRKLEVQQKLGAQGPLLAALDSLSGGGVPSGVSAEAVRLVRLIRG